MKIDFTFFYYYSSLKYILQSLCNFENWEHVKTITKPLWGNGSYLVINLTNLTFVTALYEAPSCSRLIKRARQKPRSSFGSWRVGSLIPKSMDIYIQSKQPNVPNILVSPTPFAFDPHPLLPVILWANILSSPGFEWKILPEFWGRTSQSAIKTL